MLIKTLFSRCVKPKHETICLLAWLRVFPHPHSHAHAHSRTRKSHDGLPTSCGVKVQFIF